MTSDILGSQVRLHEKGDATASLFRAGAAERQKILAPAGLCFFRRRTVPAIGGQSLGYVRPTVGTPRHPE